MCDFFIPLVDHNYLLSKQYTGLPVGLRALLMSRHNNLPIITAFQDGAECANSHKAENKTKRSPKRIGKLLPIIACGNIRKAATLLVDSAVIRNRAEQRRKESNRALLGRLDSNGV